MMVIRPIGPRLPKCGAQQVSSYLGYTGREAKLFGKAAREPISDIVPF